MCISYVTKCDRVSESLKKMLTCDLFTYLCSGIAQSMHTNELLGMMDEAPVVGACQDFVYAHAWCWITDGQVLSKIPPPQGPKGFAGPPRETLPPPKTPQGSPWCPQGPQGSPCGPQAIHRSTKGVPGPPKGSQGILRTLKRPLVTPLIILWDFPETQFFGGWVLTARL